MACESEASVSFLHPHKHLQAHGSSKSQVLLLLHLGSASIHTASVVFPHLAQAHPGSIGCFFKGPRQVLRCKRV